MAETFMTCFPELPSESIVVSCIIDGDVASSGRGESLHNLLMRKGRILFGEPPCALLRCSGSQILEGQAHSFLVWRQRRINPAQMRSPCLD